MPGQSRARPRGAPPKEDRISDAEIMEGIRRFGFAGFQRKSGIDARGLRRRRLRIEAKHNISISSPFEQYPEYHLEAFPGRLNLSVVDGHIIAFGDAHYWPTKNKPLMHRALVHFTNKLREEKTLKAVVANGDVTDFARLSHWPVVDWQKRPTVRDEMEVCQDRLQEIADAAGKAPKLWPLGNHDARWSIYLARNADELEDVDGMSLKDRFPLWAPCWSVMVNEHVPGGTTFLKHKGSRGGQNAAQLNVERAGYSIVTNHLHNAKVVPYNDLRPYTLYGVDTGCIADTYGPQFLYLEDNPRNWRSAFAILTYYKGRLLCPELVFGYGESHVQFRGEVIKV